MSITINTVAYAEDSQVNPNIVDYVSPTHSFTAKDVLRLSRTPPKPNGSVDRGVARAEAVRTKTVTLDDGTTRDAIVRVSCSLPVGMAKADADALRDDIGDLAISATAETLFWNHDLKY